MRCEENIGAVNVDIKLNGKFIERSIILNT
jgi:hypothetical protein